MKLTVVFLFCLIGVVIALHGNGGYGNNGGGNKHHISSKSSSSESEEFIPFSDGFGNGGGRPGKDSSSSSEEDKSKKCKLLCTSNAVFLDRVPTAKACNSGDPDKITSDVLQCPTCCEGWGLQRGISKDSIVSHIIGDTPADFKCVCCQRKCK